MEKYNVIVADPPWHFDDKLTMSETKRGAQSHYPVMDLNGIKLLPVAEFAAPVSILALWCPSVMVPDGLSVMNSWGFTYKQMVIWPKKKIGMGHLFRNKHEVALIGTRGQYTKMLKNRSQSTVLPIEDHKHSQKPETLQNSLELMFDGPYLELFARRARPNWVCLGNECQTTFGEDIRDSLAKLRLQNDAKND